MSGDAHGSGNVYLEGNVVCCEEYSGKYHEEDWAWLGEAAHYLVGSIDFYGEDYRHWRLLIRDGQVVEQVGRVIYGDLYDAFLEEYPALPESIKIKLNSWWVLQHL